MYYYLVLIIISDVLLSDISLLSGGFMLYSDNPLDFHVKILSLPIGVVKHLKWVEILNKFVIWHQQSILHHSKYYTP